MKSKAIRRLLTSTIIFAFLFAYIALRASFIPLIHDEAATFFYYIQTGVYLPPEAHLDANNHILNSILSSLSFQVFGLSEWALRLPNVLAFGLFLFFVYRISTQLKNKYLQWGFIISLAFAHNFIEYFGLSRGYGLSMAFLMGAIFYLMQALKYNKIQHYIWSTLFLSLAIFANFTLLNTAIIFVALLGANIILNLKDSSRSKSIFNSAILFLFIAEPMRVAIEIVYNYKEKGLLYYGELDGFWQVSVRSLIKLLTGSNKVVFEAIVVYFFIVIMLLLAATILKTKRFRDYLHTKYVFVIMLLGNLIAVLLLGNFLGVNYPEDRTGLYFFPFFIGSIVFLLDAINLKSSYKIIALLPLLFFPIHFALNMNLSYSSFWKNEHIPKRFIRKVQESSDSTKIYPATVGGYEMRRLIWAYENSCIGGNLNQIQSASYPESVSDFQVVELNINPDWEKYYSVIDYDSISNLSLLKRNNAIHKTLINQYHSDTLIHTNQVFFNLYKAGIDTVAKHNLLINTRFRFNTEQGATNISMVANISDSEGKSLHYEFIKFSWKKEFWQNEIFTGSVVIANLPENTHKVSVYLWNRDKDFFDISNIDFEIWKIETSE
jgi:hypothetical protein